MRKRDSRQDGRVTGTKRLLFRAQKRYTKLREYTRKLEAELDQCRSDLAEWRRASGATVLRIDKAKLYASISDRTGLTQAEAAFSDYAEAKGYAVYRAGWPDFLCRNPASKRVFLVEVKSDTDRLRDSQIAVFSGLEEAGVNVRIWRPGMDQPVPWRTFLTSTERQVAGMETGGRQLLQEERELFKGVLHGGPKGRSRTGKGRAAGD